MHDRCSRHWLRRYRRFVKMIREKGIEPAVMGVEVISNEILSAGVAEAAKANFNATRAVLEQAWPEVVEQ